MTAVLIILAVQALLGAFDNFWHHELQARLPQRASARRELALHAAREAIYAVVFLGLGWFEWHGALACALAALLLAELAITLADFLEEDRSRRLPPFERVLHTLLTMGYGLFLGAIAPQLWRWARLPIAFVASPHGTLSVLFTLFAIGVGAWAVRNGMAVAALGRSCRSASTVPADAPHDPRIAPAVLVAGGTGFVGRALVARLVRERRRVIVLARDLVQARADFGPRVWVVDRLDAIPPETRLDAVVHLAGA
ncbi:MAG TPA: NAD-dependent epimerase/dehydratase family protein, partial [Burkholderiaceae bacterium]